MAMCRPISNNVTGHGSPLRKLKLWLQKLVFLKTKETHGRPNCPTFLYPDPYVVLPCIEIEFLCNV